MRNNANKCNAKMDCVRKILAGLQIYSKLWAYVELEDLQAHLVNVSKKVYMLRVYLILLSTPHPIDGFILYSCIKFACRKLAAKVSLDFPLLWIECEIARRDGWRLNADIKLCVAFHLWAVDSWKKKKRHCSFQWQLLFSMTGCSIQLGIYATKSTELRFSWKLSRGLLQLLYL